MDDTDTTNLDSAAVIEMTRAEVLKQADEVIEALLRSGDEKLFNTARDASGNVDKAKLVQAAMRTRERLADKIQRQGC